MYYQSICLNHCSNAMKRHSDQGNSYKKKALKWAFAYNFRGLVHYHGGKHGNRHGRYGAREVAGSPINTSLSQSRKRVFYTERIREGLQNSNVLIYTIEILIFSDIPGYGGNLYIQGYRSRLVYKKRNNLYSPKEKKLGYAKL